MAETVVISSGPMLGNVIQEIKTNISDINAELAYQQSEIDALQARAGTTNNIDAGEF